MSIVETMASGAQRMNPVAMTILHRRKEIDLTREQISNLKTSALPTVLHEPGVTETDELRDKVAVEWTDDLTNGQTDKR